MTLWCDLSLLGQMRQMCFEPGVIGDSQNAPCAFFDTFVLCLYRLETIKTPFKLREGYLVGQRQRKGKRNFLFAKCHRLHVIGRKRQR